jgi:hypothetical protein
MSDLIADSGASGAVDRWARALRGWRLAGLASALLAEGSPLPFWAAQALYAGAPLLGDEVNTLAGLLEDRAGVGALRAALSERPA